MTKVDTESVQELFEIAKKGSEDAKEGSTIMTRGKRLQEAFRDTLAKANKSVEAVSLRINLKFKALEDLELTKKLNDKSPENVINWLVHFFKDVIERINDQGEILAFLVEKVSTILDNKDTQAEELLEQRQAHLEEALQLKQNELQELIRIKSDEVKEELHQRYEQALEQKQTEFDEKMEKKSDSMQKQIHEKCEALEKKCDEARQRGLKGNLIVSSPARMNARGVVVTHAVQQEIQYPHGYSRESMLEMVLRMVKTKTNVTITPGDVVACHPIGQRDSHTYILSIANRRPGSAWDMLTHGMATGQNFTRDNIFINFQLTKRRGELCKEVRKAKSLNQIEKFNIDANGRIFVRKAGEKHEIFSLEILKEVVAAPTGDS